MPDSKISALPSITNPLSTDVVPVVNAGTTKQVTIANLVTAGGAGTVTSVSVVTANGISGSVATATTTPAITLTLGAITPSSVATSAASPLLLTNGQLVTVALTAQTIGAATLTIPDFAGVADEFTFKTKAQTLSNKTFVAPALGTPASGVATNLTGTAAGLTAGNVTTNANLTGPITSVGNATSVAAQTGTGSTFVMNTAPAIVGGTHVAITGLGIRSTGTGAFDLKIANTENLTVSDKTLTVTLGNAARTLTFTGDATISGTNTGDQTITLTGGVTGSGTGSFVATVVTNANLTGDVTSVGNATTLANIPTAVPAAGTMVFTNVAAPASPAAGKVSIFADSTDLRFHDKNASGTIGTTVVADAGAANNFLTAISVAGAVSKAQPAFSNLSGTISTAQLGTTNTPQFAQLGLNEAAGATAGTIVASSGANNVTLIRLKRNTDTAPTGNFQDFQSAAAASLWTVDITGSLTIGGVPAARLTGTLAAAQFPALTGDVTTTAGSLTSTIANSSVTYAKIQNVTSARLLGRSTAGAGNTEEISIGSGLSLSAGSLSNSGVTSITGTTNQITASASTGAVTLSAPQNLHTGANLQAATIGLGVAASTVTSLKASGPTINTDADGTIANEDLAFTVTKNDANVRTFKGWSLKPTLNTGVSNASTTLNLIDVDTTNTVTTGLTTNLFKLSYGGVQKALIDSAGTLTLGTALSIANGGTGQTTQTAAFNALDPLTTKGDITVNDGTNSIRLAVGANNQVLTADSAQASGVKWAAAAVSKNAWFMNPQSVNRVAASTTAYATVADQTVGDTAESGHTLLVPFAGTLKNLYVITSIAQPATGSLVITVRKNRVDTTVTLTIAAGAAAGNFSDTVNSVTFAASDEVSFKLLNNATTASASVFLSVEYDAT